MKSLIYMLFFYLLACTNKVQPALQAEHSGKNSDSNKAGVAIPDAVLRLSSNPDELHKLKIKAADGDAEAATWVVEYFTMAKPDDRAATGAGSRDRGFLCLHE